jgi:FkbH-like protein
MGDVRHATQTGRRMNQAASGPAYSAPSDLALSPTPLRAVLVIGSCLISGLSEFIRNHQPGCEADYILFNNVAELPAAPPRPPAAYDFQILQIGTRTVFNEHDYFRLTDSDPEAFSAMLATVSERLKRVMESALRYNKASGMLTFVTNFLVPQQNPLGRLMPRYDLRNPVYFFEALNLALARAAADYANVHILDIELLARQFGKKYIQDDAVWTLAHNAMLTDFDFEPDQARLHPPRPMSETYELRLLDFVRVMWAELVALYRVLAQMDVIKLVVTDLDDTLWRGVLAEQDHVDANMIEGWPLGIAEALLFLKRRGVILAIASRNDEQTLLRLWPHLFHGRLRPEDFAVWKINFLPKAENFAEILRETNILARSALYIDDNPVERAAIASAFPQVRLLGQDPYLLKRILLWAPELQVPVITQEAARRTEMVQQQVVREAERAHLPRAEFLASLGLGVTLRQLAGEADPAFARAFELLNKTNQFNTTGRRWRREEAAAAFARGGAWYVFGAADRFTNYGLVGVVVTEGPEITQFVMSCRVAGLDVELAAIGEVARAIGEQGAELRASFLPTKENFLASTLFPAAGFSSRDDIWTANPASLPPPPSHILVNWAAEQRAG